MATTYQSRVDEIPLEGFLDPCVVSTSANITLSGEQTIGSTACVAGDRVLVNSQTDTTENGIHICRVGKWTRAEDFSTSSVKSGVMVVDTASGKIWQLTFTGTYKGGTTAVTATHQGDSTDIAISSGNQEFTGDNTFQHGLVSEGSGPLYGMVIDCSNALYVKVPVFANTVAANAAITDSSSGGLLGYFTDSNKLVFTYPGSTVWKDVSDLSTSA